MSEHDITVGLTTIVVLGVGAQWIARRLGFPALLLLLPAGLAAGATGLVDPEELLGDTLVPLATLLVALLLFQAGLNLRLEELPRPARGPVARLVTIGLLVTFAGAVATLLLLADLPPEVAVVTAAVLTVSGPTVVGPLLRVIRPRAPMRAILAWEGTVLDPIGATLGVVMLNTVLALSGAEGVSSGGGIIGRLGVGIACGVAGAALLVFVLARFLVTDDMEPAVAVLVAVLCFGVAEVVTSEAGLFATVTLGVIAANQRLVPTARISGFGETLEVLIIAILFILLGALVKMQDLIDNLPTIAMLVAVLVIVVRPLSVAVSLARTSLPWRDQALAAWMDPRGVVAAATAASFSVRLADAGFDSTKMLPIVFGVILGTGLIYGLSAKAVGAALGVSEPKPTGLAFVGHRTWMLELAKHAQQLGARVVVLAVRDQAGADPARDALPMHGAPRTVAHLREQIEDAGLAQAVVATETDTLVDLVVAELVEQLGRSHVFVLHPHETGVERLLDEAWSPQPFAPEVDLSALDRRMATGGEVRPCPDGLPEGAIPLAVVAPDGTVDLRPGLRRRRGASRDGTLIALVGGVPDRG